MIRIFLSGPHQRRSPFSYAALAPLFEDSVESQVAPDDADLLVFSHVMDVEDMGLPVIEAWRKRQRPIVLLSEEPFWDTIWGRRPTERHILVDTRWGIVPVVQVNHVTSTIFRHHRIPYYLLTNHRFAAVYAARFPPLARRTAHAWREALRAASMDATFLFERRPEGFHDVAWPEVHLFGLCSWRTALAEYCPPGRVERLGQSWEGGPRRLELADWFLDKIVRLDGRSRLIGAVENTHHPDYLTEKLFDAFACGARPIYWADPTHRIHELGLPDLAWLNLHGLEPAAAADRLLTASGQTDEALVDSLHDAAVALSDLFAGAAAWVSERERLAAAVPLELARILDGE